MGVAGKGSYITLEDGRTVYDAVGGAAVSCLGNSHPKVIKALKEQIDKVPCEFRLPDAVSIVGGVDDY